MGEHLASSCLYIKMRQLLLDELRRKHELITCPDCQVHIHTLFTWLCIAQSVGPSERSACRTVQLSWRLLPPIPYAPAASPFPLPSCLLTLISAPSALLCVPQSGVQKAHMHRHRSDECSHRPVTCPWGCGLTVQLAQTDEHRKRYTNI